MAKQTNVAAQLGAVVLTYVTHTWVMVGIAAWMLLIVTPQLAAGLLRGGDRGNFSASVSMALGMPLLFLSLMIAAQAKAQFAHPRATLTPNFAQPHRLVLAGILVVLTIVLPLATAFCCHLSPTGTVALAVAIAAPTLLAAHANRMLGMVAGLAAFYSTLTKWGVWWFDPAAGGWLWQVGIILVGGGLIAWYLQRLGQLREEMDDYQSFSQWQQSRKAGTEVSEQRRAVAENMRRHQFTSWFTDTWLDRIGGFHGNRLGALARLLNFGFGPPVVVQALWMTVWFGAITLFLAKFGSGATSRDGALFGASMFYLQMAMIFPGMFPSEWLARRRPRMTAELLLPLTRSQYVNGLLASTLWNAATFWLVMNLGLVLVTYTSAGPRFTLPIMGMTLLLTAAGAVGLAGVALRAAIWPSVIKRMAVLMLTMLPFQAPLLSWSVQRSSWNDPVVLLSVVAMAAVGVVMIGVARRAWLHVELA